MRLNFLFFFLLTLCLSWELSAQALRHDSIFTGQSFLDKVRMMAGEYQSSHPVEKVYIQFDKAFYAIGEDCWFKAFVVSAVDLAPTELSGVLYVDWIAPTGNLIGHQQLKLDSGTAKGDFNLFPTLLPGIYTVRAYTQWMRNQDSNFFFSTSLNVVNASVVKPASPPTDSIKSPTDLQFFAEGGIAVNNLITQIAFKAIDIHGHGLDINGKIVDEQGKHVTSLRSVHRGMGVFPFTPHPGKSYRAILSTGESFDLPPAADNGFVLNATNRSEENIVVRVQASKDLTPSTFYLIGQSRGQIISYRDSFAVKDIHRDIIISKDNIPTGVLQLTLFDATGIPRCERMIFVNHHEKLSISITSDKQLYNARDSVTLTVNVQTLQGLPVQTNLAISVTDASLTGNDNSRQNMRTGLLLQSDTRGLIEHPSWYFESVSHETTYALDLVMLTHGWRKYDWRKILNDTHNSIQYLPEKSMTLEGTVKKNSGKPMPGAQLTLLANGGDAYFTQSDSLGMFQIENIDFNDSSMLVWQIRNEKGKATDAKIIITDRKDLPVITSKTRDNTPHQEKNDAYEKLIKKYRETGIWSLDNVRLLQEVEVKAKRITNEVQVGVNRSLLRPEKNDKGTAMQFISRYALSLPFPGRAKLVTVNGFETDVATLFAIPVDQIENVIVQRVPVRTSVGAILQGYNIFVTTRNGFTGTSTGMVKQFLQGYYVAREFYHPKYGPRDISASLPDHRLTLYWNPDLKSDHNGRAIAKFYNSDIAKNLQVVVEGLANGVIGTVSTTIGAAKK